MAEDTVFDPQKLCSGSLTDCSAPQLLELAKKLCRIAAEECGENGFRGGIRPGNIYVAEDGRVAVGRAGKKGEDGWTKLELEYMAPEMFWNGDESAAADVYSIALIIYAGLNGGRLPFTEDGQTAEIRANALRRRMSGDSFQMPESADEKLAEILSCALAFEPEKRYADAYEMLKALWEYCGDEPEEINRAERPVPEEISEPDTPKVEEPKPEPESKSEKKAEPAVAPSPKQEEKPAAKKTEPKSSPKPEPEAKSEKEIKNAQPKPQRSVHEIKSARRSVLTIALIAIVLVGVGAARDKISFDAVPSAEQTPEVQITAEPTVAPTAEPTPTPETTPEPSKTPSDVQYMLYSEDVSWDEAENRCKELGGHLAVIKSADDYEKLCSLLSGCSAQYVWIGAYRDSAGQIKWTDGNSYDFSAWAQGEPSVTDSYDGAAENYIMLVKQADGSWLYNDSRSNPMANYAQFYSGRIAYICQIG